MLTFYCYNNNRFLFYQILSDQYYIHCARDLPYKILPKYIISHQSNTKLEISISDLSYTNELACFLYWTSAQHLVQKYKLYHYDKLNWASQADITNVRHWSMLLSISYIIQYSSRHRYYFRLNKYNDQPELHQELA